MLLVSPGDINVILSAVNVILSAVNVILSEAKNLPSIKRKILHFVQDDRG